MDSPAKNTGKARWYYVIVQDPGTPSEAFVGFSDPKTESDFLPAFESKENAKTCFSLMPKDLFMGNYEAQAVIEEDLYAAAEKTGHRIYLLDDKGTLLKHLN